MTSNATYSILEVGTSVGTDLNDTFSNITSNITSSPDDSDTRNLYRVVGIVQAIICLVGIVFNILNIYVLVKLVTRRRGVSPTYHLLIAMGVADIMVLFFIGLYVTSVYVARHQILLWTDLADEHHDFYHLILNLWMFPANLFSMASNWLVVATTFFRFLAVAFPMKVCQW